MRSHLCKRQLTKWRLSVLAKKLHRKGSTQGIDDQLFDDQHFDDQHLDELHYKQHFDVNLEVAKAHKDVEEISEDRRWPRQVSLPEKF